MPYFSTSANQRVWSRESRKANARQRIEAGKITDLVFVYLAINQIIDYGDKPTAYQGHQEEQPIPDVLVLTAGHPGQGPHRTTGRQTGLKTLHPVSGLLRVASLPPARLGQWEKAAVPQGKHAKALKPQPSCSEATVLTPAPTSHATLYEPLNPSFFKNHIHHSGEVTDTGACLQIQTTHRAPLLDQRHVANENCKDRS